MFCWECDGQIVNAATASIQINLRTNFLANSNSGSVKRFFSNAAFTHAGPCPPTLGTNRSNSPTSTTKRPYPARLLHKRLQARIGSPLGTKAVPVFFAIDHGEDFFNTCLISSISDSGKRESVTRFKML